MTLNSDRNDNHVIDKHEKGRTIAIGIASVVYLGVVAAATVLFISFILQAFPPTAYFSQFIMGLAGVMVGGSMIAFPVTLHNWAVHGWHRKIAAALYYGEIFIIGVNTVVAFSHLLSKNAGVAAPLWVVLYEPFSIFAIIYTLFAWGTIFLTDPVAEAKDKEIANHQEYKKRIAEKKKEFLDSIEGEDVIIEAASEEIRREFNPGNHKTGRRHFGSGRVQKELPEPARPAPQQSTQGLAFPQHIIWNRGNDPAAYYDPSSEFALPCGHTGGASDDHKGHLLCSVCGADVTSHFFPARKNGVNP